MLLKRFSLIIIFSLLFCHSSHASANPVLKFHHLSIEEGLSQSIVECIIQDSRGFMWFGTEDGLNKYDGYGFSVLRNDPDDPNSLSQNHVTCVFETSDGLLWIGAFNGGLNCYDPATKKIKAFRANPNDPAGLCHDIIWDILEDDDGQLWLATEGGLSHFDPRSARFTSYFHHPHNPRSLSHNVIHRLCKDKQGYLWLATENGLNRFDTANRQFTGYYHDPHNDNSLACNKVRTVYADRAGAIWIGTDGGGLDKLTFAADGMPQFTHLKNDPHDPSSLSHNSVYSLYQDPYGVLWVGTKGGGLNLYDAETQSFTRYKRNPLDPYSLSYDEIYDIFEDRTGVMWLGTYGGGVNKVSQAADQFPQYKSDPSNPNSLNHDIVWSINEDQEGILWIGTHGGGLNRFDRVHDKWMHYQHQPGDPNSLSNDIVRVVYIDRQNILWLGTHGGGLNRFDPSTGQFRAYQHDPHDPFSLSHDEIRSIFEDARGNLWIGTYGGGLNKFNRETGHFQHYVHDPADANSICNNYIRVMYEDKNGLLWIGTQGGGLNRFDQKTEQFTLYKKDAQDSTSLSSDFVFSILENEDGALWLGTYGGGLNKFDPRSGRCTRYTSRDGLPSNSIYGFVRDDDGNLWISTNNGISKFNPHNESFVNYNVDDGLQSSEFNGGSFFKSQSGEIFFGGINGFNAFYPENIRENEFKPPIVLTSFRKLNEPVELGTPLTDLRSLKLSWKDYVFAFEFSALDFTAPEWNQYAYKMEGLDKEWLHTDARKRFASYTTLAPGKYTFRVKGSNNDNVWNEDGIAIQIRITPPFWRTPLFRTALVLLFLLFLLFLYRAYQWRMQAIRQKRHELEERVTERTQAAQKLEAALEEVKVLKNRLQAENIYLQDEIKLVTNFENIITRSTALKKVLVKVEQVAATDATVLVLGESGTGKELIARAIHRISDRCDRILVKVNCSALPATLIESELFGHEKGAYTGAISKKAGRFELADGGTLFLDEIGDLPIELQSKLLRVLQEGEFERLGGTETLKVDVRIIAATNRDLRKEIDKGHFREDLFFRLNVFPIDIPPLRDRKEDIPLLVNYFIKKYSVRTGKTFNSVPQHVMDRLEEYRWPGNVRELENIIERAVITSSEKKFRIGDWLPTENSQVMPDFVSLEENERRHIVKTLQLTNWRVSGDRGAAKMLGINAKTLESRMKKLAISKNG
ncbi:sigma 54-interacting transcriptional regulator [candidate division KSB1 bacterium]|nr:sigma 54-interacting transcriptional regulator [candidate division KSB1 bacterium]RQW11073.1 MAG: AAA family ATPase [candidate division KSB1 bacterium]